MRIILNIILLLLSGSLWCQNTIKLSGYIISIQNNDSVIKLNDFYSIEIYNQKGELISDHHISLSPDSLIKNRISIVQPINNTDNSISGWIIDGDSSYVHQIIDTINKRQYTIFNKDTQFVFALEFTNKIRIKETCLKGCSNFYSTHFYFNKNKLLDSAILISNETGISFSKDIFQYDSLGRVLYRYSIGENNIKYMEFWWEYDDINNTRRESNSQRIDPNGIYEEVLYFLDRDNIPNKKQITIIEGNKKVIYTIEYKKVK